MTELGFAGYRSFVARPDDPLRIKWNGVRDRLEVPPSGLPSPTIESIAAFNATINHMITYAPEAVGKDVWQDPAGTLFLGRGDCEDFAILKYAALLKVGIPVRLVVGEIKNILANEPHAWCAAFIEDAWRCLDQKFDHIIKVEDYINWLPIAAMNDDQVVRFGREFSINEQLHVAV